MSARVQGEAPRFKVVPFHGLSKPGTKLFMGEVKERGGGVVAAPALHVQLQCEQDLWSVS